MIPVAGRTSNACAAMPLPAMPALPDVAVLARHRAAAAARVSPTARDARPLAPAPAIALHRPFALRLLAAVAGAWSGWREAVRERTELRALSALDPLTLKDIGLAERVPRLERPSWLDLERARW